MMLQFAVGPMCLLVFKTAGESGLNKALVLVSAIALIDALYIALAGIGMASVIKNKKFIAPAKFVGGTILALFGINIILGVFGYSLIPEINLFSNYHSAGIFIEGLILTSSNPLTIIFWGGVFTAKSDEIGVKGSGLYLFGLGCVMSTVLFLSFIAALGSVVTYFLPVYIMNLLNIAVGSVIILFAVRLFIKKT